MIHEFLGMYEAGQCSVERLRSVRVKLLVACQWKCAFCHQEGNFNAQQMRLGPEVVDTLKQFRDELGFTEVHFTGGEPTIHPQFPQFLEAAAKLNMVPKVTSNGQSTAERLRQFVGAGLQEINVSVHKMTAAGLARMQDPPLDEAWGQRQLDRQLACIEAAAAASLRTKVNTVVSDSFADALDVFAFCRERRLEWRVMNELSSGEQSYACLAELAGHLDASIVAATVIRGSSSCSLSLVSGDGTLFKAKLIRPFRLIAMCTDCPLFNTNTCFEFAYGPRLESMNGKLFVRSCLHRQGPPFVIPVSDFFVSPLGNEFRQELSGIAISQTLPINTTTVTQSAIDSSGKPDFSGTAWLPISGGRLRRDRCKILV